MTDILKIHCSAWRRSSVGYLMPTAVPDTMSPGHSSVEGKQACPGRCTVYPNCDCYKARLPQKCSTCNYRSFLVLGVRAHLRRMVRTQGSGFESAKCRPEVASKPNVPEEWCDAVDTRAFCSSLVPRITATADSLIPSVAIPGPRQSAIKANTSKLH